MYKTIVTENPELQNEDNLSEKDNAFLQGVICIKNVLSDMLTEYTSEAQASDENTAEYTVEDILSYFEDKIEEFESEFIVTMIESYKTNK